MNVLLNGATGAMGKEVAKAVKKIQESEEIKIVCGVDIAEDLTGEFPIYSDTNKIREKVDVIIDFSVPKATFQILEFAKEKNIPIVIATTGFKKEELDKIQEIAKEIPIFRSSNMSVDINLMATIVAKVAQTLRNTDIEIIETHHNRKIDSPSGTAILLADAINEVFENQKKYDFERMQKSEEEKRRNWIFFY